MVIGGARDASFRHVTFVGELHGPNKRSTRSRSWRSGRAHGASKLGRLRLRRRPTSRNHLACLILSRVLIARSRNLGILLTRRILRNYKRTVYCCRCGRRVLIASHRSAANARLFAMLLWRSRPGKPNTGPPFYATGVVFHLALPANARQDHIRIGSTMLRIGSAGSARRNVASKRQPVRAKVRRNEKPRAPTENAYLCCWGRLLQSLVCAQALCIQPRAPTSKVLEVLAEKTFAKPCVRTGFVYSAVPWKGAIDGSALELAF